MKEKKQHRFRIVLNAPVILIFVSICCIATLLGELSDGKLTVDFFMTYRASLKNPLTYLRTVTHVFGHSGWTHFIGNMSYVLLLGPLLEEKYGGKNLIEVIGITAVITAVLNMIFFQNVALCGASGVVFAFILLSSLTSFKEGEIPLTFILVAVIYIGQQIYEGITVDDNVSNLSHVLGGMVGAVSGFVYNKEKEK